MLEIVSWHHTSMIALSIGVPNLSYMQSLSINHRFSLKLPLQSLIDLIPKMCSVTPIADAAVSWDLSLFWSPRPTKALFYSLCVFAVLFFQKSHCIVFARISVCFLSAAFLLHTLGPCDASWLNLLSLSLFPSFSSFFCVQLSRFFFTRNLAYPLQHTDNHTNFEDPPSYCEQAGCIAVFQIFIISCTVASCVLCIFLFHYAEHADTIVVSNKKCTYE